MKGRGGILPALLLLCTLLTAGCFNVRCDRQVRTELYFGMSVPANGGVVSQTEWEDFLAKEVTPRFPDGFTVMDGKGQWRDAKGNISSEPSKVLVIIRGNDKAADGKLEEIRKAYRERFRQESVLRTDTPVKASF